jgi:alpha,alpha-trehalose phosphorylase
MILDASFPVEPWVLRETESTLDRLAQTESLFALPRRTPWPAGRRPRMGAERYSRHLVERPLRAHPIPYTESAYENPEAGQTVINVTSASSAESPVVGFSGQSTMKQVRHDGH